MVSAALGFAAEATSPRLYEVQDKISGDCTYPKSPAQGLGIATLLTLLVFRCYCPKALSQSSRARLCLVSSW
ncbi:hypothetical protein L1987_31689 [Smallanthus sonchifolius]|uniref:Uncharacterized protein n=1 Tax=Smallanthus sonchifolius TaxID=185202 RepID=A0ACB9I772_9ASTR|nr:hypothetical protein L1987_31689 [Smallanthus sonchifolius]